MVEVQMELELPFVIALADRLAEAFAEPLDE